MLKLAGLYNPYALTGHKKGGCYPRPGSKPAYNVFLIEAMDRV